MNAFQLGCHDERTLACARHIDRAIHSRTGLLALSGEREECICSVYVIR